MKTPEPAWDIRYQHDRRNARHRCRCCARILNAGDAVIMARVGAKQTYAIHAECGLKQHGMSDQTWRDAMVAWGTEYLKACGWRLAA